MGRLNYFGINTQEWTSAKDCELDARELRRMVADFNDKYGSDDNHKHYIISSARGYKLTRNLKEIREHIERDERLAKKRLAIIRNRKKSLERFEALKAHGGQKTHE